MDAILYEFNLLTINFRLTIFHSFLFILNFLLFAFSGKIVRFLSLDEKKININTWTFRFFNILFFFLHLLDLFLVGMNITYQKQLSKIALTLISFYTVKMFLHVLSHFIRQKFGDQKIIDSKNVNIENYSTRVVNILTTSVVLFFVITVPGMLTGSIRYALGLKKDRNDHRHHFVDAAVVGIFSRSYLKKIRRDNSRNKKVIIEPPYPDYRNHVEEIRENLKVRHTIDSNANVKWFEETAFGVLEEPIIIGEKQYKYTKRIEVEKIKPKKVELIVSNKIKKDLSELTEAQYEEYFSKYGIKKIKIYENKSNMFVIEHNGHKKAYPSEGNHSVEIWKIPKNKKLNEEGYCLLPRTYYEKARDPNLRPTPAAKKVFTIRKNSLIQSQIDPERIIYKVVKLDPTNNRIYARMLNVAANEGTKNKQITFRNFLKEKYRNVHVSEGGRVYFSPSPFDGKNYRIIKSGDLLLET